MWLAAIHPIRQPTFRIGAVKLVAGSPCSLRFHRIPFPWFHAKDFFVLTQTHGSILQNYSAFVYPIWGLVALFHVCSWWHGRGRSLPSRSAFQRRIAAAFSTPSMQPRFLFGMQSEEHV
jgi:hypothetical protein